MSDGSPVEQLAAVGLVIESDLNDADKDVINTLTGEEVTALISAADVVQAVEGPVAVVHCTVPDPDEGPACNRVDRCATHLLWTRLSRVVVDLLDSVSLEDLREIEKRVSSRTPDPSSTEDVQPGSGKQE